jgi:pimeloyl-ACP methyl ester carboxylesterase
MSADQYFEHHNIRLRYRDEGAGPPIVFLHGWTLDLESWEPQAHYLQNTLRVIRLDRRGFGLSGGNPSIDDDVGDLVALLDHLHIDKVTLVGVSQGARVAISFGTAHPSRLSALVLDGAPDPTLPSMGGVARELPMARYRELARIAGIEAFRREWLQHPFMQLHTQDAAAHELLRQIVARYPGRDLLDWSTQRDELLSAEVMRNMRVPTLVINGALDTERRKQVGDTLASRLPNAERKLVPNSGHLANIDEPAVYNDIIRQFLVRQARIAA